jgi:hypothetical protein
LHYPVVAHPVHREVLAKRLLRRVRIMYHQARDAHLKMSILECEGGCGFDLERNIATLGEVPDFVHVSDGAIPHHNPSPLTTKQEVRPVKDPASLQYMFAIQTSKQMRERSWMAPGYRLCQAEPGVAHRLRLHAGATNRSTGAVVGPGLILTAVLFLHARSRVVVLSGALPLVKWSGGDGFCLALWRTVVLSGVLPPVQWIRGGSVCPAP